MEKLIIENFRCFGKRQEVPIAPLTLLVGENSTGKTTFLAAHRIISDVTSGNYKPDFNEAPFNLGSFSQVVYKSAIDNKQCEKIIIGFCFKFPSPKRIGVSDVEVHAIFKEMELVPQVDQLVINAPDIKIVFDFKKETFRKISGIISNKKYNVETSAIPASLFGGTFSILHDLSDFAYANKSKGLDTIKSLDKEEIKILDELVKLVGDFGFPRPRPSSPIRPKPMRTYDRLINNFHPEGDHMPTLLRNLKKNDPRIFKKLKDFGMACGLFDDIDVKQYGDSSSDPFQISVDIGKMVSNLIDVGYGVSQVLPLLVDGLTGKEGLTYLLQQPEVHLHPRAQAQLGTFFGYLAAKEGKRYLIETHSDYLVDRVCMDVRDKPYLKPEHVVILYFEHGKDGVTIHPIHVDEMGNLVGAPPSYRDFFLKEQDRYLTQC